VEQNVLTIKAERHFELREDDEILVSERPQGAFTRQLMLAESLESDRLEANYDHGVLTITIPVAEHAKPRRVQVSSSEAPSRIIEGHTATSP
jgi:HSP20 family protein